MPVYEFYCKRCDDVFEYLMMGKSDVPQCPKCRNKDVAKQFSVFGFTPKPHGFRGFTSGGKTVTSSSGSSCSACGTHNCSTCG